MDYQQPENNSKNEKALEVAKEKTRSHAKHLWQLVARYSKIDELGKSRQETTSHPSPKKGETSYLLSVLTAVPYILLGLFIVSFFWDFNAISFEFWNRNLQLQGLLRIVSVSGLIGFFTNWLAITMLFKPAEKRPILGHGLIPAQKERIAYRMAQTVSTDLINPEIIKRKLHESNAISRYREESTKFIKGIIDDPEFRNDLKKWVIIYIDDMIADPEIRAVLAKRILEQIEDALHGKSFEKVALKAYSFVKGQEMQQIIEEALNQIPSSVENGLNKMDDLLDQLPRKIDENGEAIENIVTSLLYKLINQLDVQKLVEENLRRYDEQHIAAIIRSATNEQLRYIQYLGAVLGFIGGFIIWEPLLSIIALGLITVFLLLLDQLLYSIQKEEAI